jgi:hypothetical protein
MNQRVQCVRSHHESFTMFSVPLFSNIFQRDRTPVVIVLVLICTLILPAILLYPFNGDNDIWQWIASEFVRYGWLPYVRSWDNDFPGIAIVHATAIFVFGNSMLAFRVVEYLAISLTVIALYRTSRLWLSEIESLVGCFIFSLFYVYGRWDCMGQRDNFAVLPILLAVHAFTSAYRRNGSKSRFWLLGAGGAMVGIATCIRPTYVLLLPLPILTLGNTKDFRAAFVILAGFLVPISLLLLPFAFTPDGVQQVYIATIRYNVDIYSQFPPSGAQLSLYLHNLLKLRTIMIFVLASAWLAVYIVNWVRGIPCVVQSVRERLFLISVSVALLAGMFSQIGLAAAHFTPFYACFTPVLTKMLFEMMRFAKQWQPVAIAVMLGIITTVLYPWGLVRSFVEGSFSMDSAYSYFSDSFRAAQENSVIASYLIHHSKPDEFIEIIGDAGISWRTPRPKSTRFQTEWQFLLPGSSGQLTEYQRRWRSEFIESLQRTSPKYIVITRDPGETSSTLFSVPMGRTPEIQHFIETNYTFDTLLDLHCIYVRK